MSLLAQILQPPQRGYHVYELRGDDETLLYIGISMQAPGERLEDHLADQPWAPEIRAERIVHQDLSKREALRIEKNLIRTKRPIYNLQHSLNAGAARSAIAVAETKYGRPSAARARPGALWSRRGRRRMSSEAAFLVALAGLGASLYRIWQEDLSPQQKRMVLVLGTLVGCASTGLYLIRT